MLLGTKNAINKRLESLEKAILARKRDMLATADEGGTRYASAKELQFGAAQCDWALQEIERRKEKVGKEEAKKGSEEE
ncbi:MAG: hypothetical protein PHF64_00395 [Methanoregula sp.]|nr:hypothetical protein [Methanoregula sp.]